MLKRFLAYYKPVMGLFIADTVCAVVVAGGSGQRFGNPGGKQLVNVAGRPLMSWSIRAFDRSEKVGHIVVVCPAERRAEMRRLAIDPFDYDTPISFADAGASRRYYRRRRS